MIFAYKARDIAPGGIKQTVTHTLKRISYREAVASTLCECLRLGELVRSEVPEGTKKRNCIDLLTRMERLLFDELAANEIVTRTDLGPGHVEGPGEEPSLEPEETVVWLLGQCAALDEPFELDPRD